MNKKTRLLTALCLIVVVTSVNSAFAATNTATLSVTALATFPPVQWRSVRTIRWQLT
jgi:hypothetical protein